MKKRTTARFLSAAALCLSLLLSAAAAETRQGTIALEGMEETIEETLFESPLGFSFWYANDSLKAYCGEAGDIEGAVVSALWTDDSMVLSMISEDDAMAYIREYGVSIKEQPAAPRMQIDVYRDLENGVVHFLTLIAENGQYIRAAGAYSMESAEGNAKYFQRVLDNIIFNAGT